MTSRFSQLIGALLGAGLGLASALVLGNGHQVKSGTGFFIAPDNMLMTSAHVVSGCQAITVFAVDGSERLGRIVGTDADLDLAILAVSGPAIGHHLAGLDTQVRVGDRVYTIGYGILVTEPYRPFYFTGTVRGENTLANGDRVLVVNTYVPAGSSGAPLVDPQSRLVGAIIGRYTADPDQGVVIPARSIRAFALRAGVTLPTAPEPAMAGMGHNDTLLNATALVQCKPD